MEFRNSSALRPYMRIMTGETVKCDPLYLLDEWCRIRWKILQQWSHQGVPVPGSFIFQCVLRGVACHCSGKGVGQTGCFSQVFVRKETSVWTLVRFLWEPRQIATKTEKGENGIFEEIFGNFSGLSPPSSLHLPLHARHDRPARRDKRKQCLNEANPWEAHSERRQQSGLCQAGDRDVDIAILKLSS